MGFLPTEALNRPGTSHNNPLVTVVRPMPTAARQAMYAAASKGLIKRKTWEGCAWNQAGHVQGQRVSSVTQAAEVFGCPSGVVSSFISVWDGLKGTDAHCTRLLMEAIDLVGITTPANMKRAARVVRGLAYKSLDTKFKEELDSIETLADIPGLSDVEIEATQVLVGCLS